MRVQCGPPWSTLAPLSCTLPNQMCGYQWERKSHLAPQFFAQRRSSSSLSLPLFNVELEEGGVWESAEPIRETHSARAILGQSLNRRLRASGLGKGS